MSHDPHPQQPSAFLGGGLPYHPQPVGPSYTQDARAPYVPRAIACLTVRRDERVVLNAEAVRLLPSGTAAVELDYPIRENDRWRLSCEPAARCRLSSDAGRRFFRAPLAARALFAQQPATVQALQFELLPVGNGIFHLHPLTVTN